jgi:hypothetical protein
MAIWITTMSGGSEIEVGDGSKLPKGTPISILYNRKSGPFSLTIDRGEGSKSTFTAVFSEARKGGYLRTAMNERFLPLGNLASPDGSRHIYTACSGDECVSTSILVTTATSSIKQMSKFLWLPWNQ